MDYPLFLDVGMLDLTPLDPGSLGKWGIIHSCRLENSTTEGNSTPIVAIGVSVAQFCDDQDDQAAKLSDLSDETIEVARAWKRLLEGERRAIRMAIQSLQSDFD